jgi:nicotinate-nucleotide--dimethylbenzimidazole phosphoribosyltransferase
MILNKWIKQIKPLDLQSMKLAQNRWDSIAKPLGSLGELESFIIKIAGIQQSSDISIDRKGVLIFCADNGVVAEGVTQTGSEVTQIVAGNFLSGETSVCKMAEVAGADILPVDIGMNGDVTGMRTIKTSYGTRNIAKEPAISYQEAEQAILSGISLVKEYQQTGYQILATGEMGIGNTTTSSAVAAVLLNRPAEEMVGRGAGLSDEGLKTKIRVVEQAIAAHHPNASDAVDVLAKVGGFDLAGLTGAFIGGAVCRVPMILDGFISAVAALCAVQICPMVSSYLIPSHLSREPASKAVMDALELTPIIHAGMHLGEGTGAVSLFPLLDMANAVYRSMSTFEEIQVESYHYFEDESNVSVDYGRSSQR